MITGKQRNTLCPLCSKEEFKPFFVHMDIYQCVHCGLVFNLSPDLLPEQYYEVKADYENSIKNIEKLKARKRNVNQRIKLLSKYLNQDKVLLDIGCNEGLFLSKAKNKVKMAFGIEPNIAMAKYAQDKDLEIKCGTLEQIDFPQEYFNIITMFHIIEHLKDPLYALNKVHSWLKPGGLLVVEVPNIESPMSKIKGANWSMIRTEHRLYFTQNTLNALLNKTEFTVISKKTRDFDQYRTGIGRSLQKLGLVIQSTKKQKKLVLNEKPSENKIPEKKTSFFKKIRRGIQLPIKYILGYLVQYFNRGDYLFVIAVKSG